MVLELQRLMVLFETRLVRNISNKAIKLKALINAQFALFGAIKVQSQWSFWLGHDYVANKDNPAKIAYQSFLIESSP
jgi:hypothetical protein